MPRLFSQVCPHKNVPAYGPPFKQIMFAMKWVRCRPPPPSGPSRPSPPAICGRAATDFRKRALLLLLPLVVVGHSWTQLCSSECTPSFGSHQRAKNNKWNRGELIGSLPRLTTRQRKHLRLLTPSTQYKNTSGRLYTH